MRLEFLVDTSAYIGYIVVIGDQISDCGLRIEKP